MRSHRYSTLEQRLSHVALPLTLVLIVAAQVFIMECFVSSLHTKVIHSEPSLKRNPYDVLNKPPKMVTEIEQIVDYQNTSKYSATQRTTKRRYNGLSNRALTKAPSFLLRELKPREEAVDMEPVFDSRGNCSCWRWQDCNEPIDLVITWVNGSDPIHAAARRYWMSMHGIEPSEATDERRWRDNGELRYTLRSVLQHAPWIRHIYLLTANQIPTWLNRRHLRVRVISHDEVFPNSDDLPTFNSYAIELHLHRIPGLSKHFIYMNDDWLITKPVCPEDFITYQPAPPCLNAFDPSTHEVPIYTIFVERENFIATSTKPQNSFFHGQQNAFELLKERYGVEPRRIPAHAPMLFNRDIRGQVAKVWADELKRTSAHRFRQPSCLSFNFLYFHVLHETTWVHDAHRDLLQDVDVEMAANVTACLLNAFYEAGDQKQALSLFYRYGAIMRHPPLEFVLLKDDISKSWRAGDREILSPGKLMANSPCFMAFNDDMQENNDEIIAELHKFFEYMFPTRAEWESE